MDKKKVVISAAAGAALLGAAGLIAHKNRKKGILLFAPEDVGVSLFCGKEEIEPTYKKAENGTVYRSFFDLPVFEDRVYWFKASGEGYYTLQKDINYTGSRLITVNADPGKKGGRGYEPTVVNALSSEAVSRLLGADKRWKKLYKEVYLTPTLSSPDKAPHEFTSYDEMLAFLDGLKGNFTRFSIGKSSSDNAFDIPMLIFTKSDISAAQSYREAAEIINKNGKPTVMYMAQIHGNEPAGGDGALAVSKALDGYLAEKLCRNINILIVPRANPDGAKAFSRYDLTHRTDMNRDHIKVRTDEVAAVHSVYNAFLPAVLIDGHEYFNELHKKTGDLKDVLVGVGGGINTKDRLAGYGTEITGKTIKELNREGIRAAYYPAAENAGTVRHHYMVNTANFSTGRGYFSLKGCISILVESFGMNYGKQAFERRTVSQFITVTSLLKEISEKAKEINLAAKNEREEIISSGETFDKDRLFCLDSGSLLQRCETVYNPEFNLLSGRYVDKKRLTSCYYYDKPERSRSYATAFVVPKSAENIGDVLSLAKKHGISYKELAAGTVLPLKQYGGEPQKNEKNGFFVLKEAELSDELEVTFGSGAYFFPCNQLSGLLMCYLFEPDVNDTESFGSSLCQSGILKPEEIFRLERNLSEVLT